MPDAPQGQRLSFTKLGIAPAQLSAWTCDGCSGDIPSMNVLWCFPHFALHFLAMVVSIAAKINIYHLLI
jgi:hypothetical protein